MFKTISTAIVATFVITSSASACGFFTKLTYGGTCSQSEYEEKVITNAIESGETVTTTNNAIIVVVDGVGTYIQKNELPRGGRQQVLDFIKQEVGETFAGRDLQAAFDAGEISEAQLKEAQANLEAGLTLDGFNDEGINEITGDVLEGSIEDQRLNALADTFNSDSQALVDSVLDRVGTGELTFEEGQALIDQGQADLREACGAGCN